MGAKVLCYLISYGVVAAVACDVRAEPNTCATAYEQAQEFRADGKLRQARKALEACVQPTCSEFVRTECGRWLSEVEASMPSLVLVVKKGDKELEVVRVLYDDEPIKESLDGKAVPVDPGQHTLQFLTDEAQPTSLKIVIREGEKNRQVVVELPSDNERRSNVDAKTEPKNLPAPQGSSRTWLPYAFGGVALLGVSGFVAFGLMGNSEYAERERTCGHTCSDAEVQSVRTKYYLADVSLGVGLVSLGVASYLFITSNHGEQKRDTISRGTAFDVRMNREGGLAEIRTHF
jgi:hypothetical protein